MPPVQGSSEDAREHSKQASLTPCQDTRDRCQPPHLMTSLRRFCISLTSKSIHRCHHVQDLTIIKR
jgi:hypothetical protein